MLHLKQGDLPHRGSTYNFVGADHGDVGISAFLFHGAPGSGPGPHRHPYDEVQFIQSGRGLWVVEGNEFEVGAGEVLVIKAGEIHNFQSIGPEPLIQLDIHLNSRFIQENVTPTT